jgi:hypothetical protein
MAATKPTVLIVFNDYKHAMNLMKDISLDKEVLPITDDKSILKTTDLLKLG